MSEVGRIAKAWFVLPREGLDAALADRTKLVVLRRYREPERSP